jgi:hypothetical protein
MTCLLEARTGGTINVESSPRNSSHNSRCRVNWASAQRPAHRALGGY